MKTKMQEEGELTSVRDFTISALFQAHAERGLCWILFDYLIMWSKMLFLSNSVHFIEFNIILTKVKIVALFLEGKCTFVCLDISIFYSTMWELFKKSGYCWRERDFLILHQAVWALDEMWFSDFHENDLPGTWQRSMLLWYALPQYINCRACLLPKPSFSTSTPHAKSCLKILWSNNQDW